MNHYERMTQNPIKIEFGKYQLFFNKYIFEEYLDSRLSIERIDEKAGEIIIKFCFIPDGFDLEDGAYMYFSAKYKNSLFLNLEFEDNDEAIYLAESLSQNDFKLITIRN